MSSDLKKDLKSLFCWLLLNGVPLPRDVEEDLLERCPGSGWAKIGKDPVVHFAVELGRHWVGRLEGNAPMAELAAWLLLRLGKQMGYYKGGQGWARDYDHLSLVVRRIWLLAIMSPGNLHPERVEAFLRRGIIQLPHPVLNTDFPVMKAATEARLRNFLYWLRRLQEDLSPSAQRDNCDLADDDGISSKAYLAGDDIRLRQGLAPKFHSEHGLYRDNLARRLQTDFATARMQASATCLEPVALLWLRELTQIEDFSKFDTPTLRHQVLWLLELYNGIPSRDGLGLGLDKDSSSLGYLTETEINLKVNSGYYPSAGAWEEDELSLPLAPILAKILAELVQRYPNAKKISDFHPPDEDKLMDSHRDICNLVIKNFFPGWNGNSIRIDRVFLRAAILSCDLSAALVGLLRAHPLGGARGQSAYLSVLYQTIISAYNQIHRVIHDQAGLAFEEHSFCSREPNRLYGKRAMSMASYSAATLRYIREASTENDLVACAIRLLRAIGYRRRNAQLNPWLLVRRDIIALLEIQDKLAGDWFPPRFAPLSPAYLRLVEEIGRIFGVSEFLTYFYEGQECTLNELPNRLRDRARTILEHNEQHNPGRTALFNALLAKGCGDVVRQVLLGHGPKSTHLYGIQLPVPPKRVLEEAAEVLFSVCREEGLDDCAVALTERLKEIPKRIRNSAFPVPEVQQKRAGFLNSKIPPEMHEPLSYAEKCLKDSVYLRFRGRRFPGEYAAAKLPHRRALGWPLDNVGLMTAAALELNLPLESLLDYQAYYTYRSLLYDNQSQRIYLLVVMEHHDDGGLAKIPVFVCSFAEESENRFMKLVRYRFDRAVERTWKKRKHAAAQYAKKGSTTGSRLHPGCDEGELRHKIKSEVMNHRLFGEEDIDKFTVDEEMDFLTKGGGESLASRGAFSLLNRITKCRCTLWYPALLAGVLCKRADLGLNHFSIQDQLNVRNGKPSELKNLIEGAWSETEPEVRLKLPSQAARTRLLNEMRDLEIIDWRLIFQADAKLTGRRGPKLRAPLVGGQLAEKEDSDRFLKLRLKIRSLELNDWKLLIKGWAEQKPKQATFAGGLLCMLDKMGLSFCQAQGLSRRIKAHLRREGKLFCSSPLPLVTRTELSTIVERSASLVGSFRTRNRRKLRGDAGDSEECRAEMILELNLLHRLMARPKEVWGLHVEDVMSVADKTYVFIPGGKTENARRTPYLLTRSLPRTRSLREQESDPARIGPRLLTVLCRRHPKSHHSVSASLSAKLNQAAGRNLRPYDLRHLGIIHALQDCVDWRLANGNFGHAMANLSVQVGHGAPTITLFTYVGTAVFQFM